MPLLADCILFGEQQALVNWNTLSAANLKGEPEEMQRHPQEEAGGQTQWKQQKVQVWTEKTDDQWPTWTKQMNS